MLRLPVYTRDIINNCIIENVSNELHLKLEHHFEKQIRSKTNEPNIWGLSYSSATDELFFADNRNHVVSSMHLRDSDSTNDVSVVVRGASHVYSVCHMHDWDTLLLCSSELLHGTQGFWLVALVRITTENGWREANRVQCKIGRHMCALSKSRVLLGPCRGSREMELFGVQRDYPQTNPRIALVTRIQLPEEYWGFSAPMIQQSTARDTLIAVSYKALQAVSVH